MLKSSRIFSVCITGIYLMLLQSCIKPPRDFDPRDGNNVYDGCRVIKTVNTSAFGSVTTRLFVYNNNGDPVSAKSDKTSTGNPDLSFKYDNKHRLTEFAGLYTNGLYEYLHRYTWVNNRIAIDSEYNFGVYNGPLPTKAAYHYFTYDNLNRIIRDSVAYINLGITGPILTYNYDDAGNLAAFGLMYDNKLNLHRTNKVWMFIDRDYSVNNPFTATAYNSTALPLHVATAAEKTSVTFVFGRFFFSGATDITYACK